MYVALARVFVCFQVWNVVSIEMVRVSMACFYGKNKRSPTVVLITQGDVSDIDLDDDDEENVTKLTRSTKPCSQEDRLTEIRLDVEIHDKSEDNESTDDVVGQCMVW